MNNTSSKADKPVATDYWANRRGKIFSHKGGALFHKGAVYSHGYSLLDDLIDRVSYTQVLLLNATGRLPERRLADWVEAAYICLSWPEPRIWCNHISALGGTLRTSAVAATAAGMLAADSTMYGILPLLEGVGFIQNALKKKHNGTSPDEIIDTEAKRYRGKPQIVGYARPIARGDERVIALERVTKNLGFSIGEHLELAYQLQDMLYERYDETMNINGYASAFLSDQGFTPQEVYQLSAMCVNAGVLACYIDTNEQPPESFLPLRCDDIDYQGKPPRPVPDKNESQA